MSPFERAVGEAALKQMGTIPNIIKAVEEFAELQQALCKYMVGSVDIEVMANVHEELADASIMLNRMLSIFDATEVQDWKDSKLEAMAERLGVEILPPGADRSRTETEGEAREHSGDQA